MSYASETSFLPADPVIAVVGSGAVGGYYGARLAQHGHAVHFLLRSDYEAVRRSGWTVKSCDGDFSIGPEAVHAYDEPAKMPRADLVLVALKATANEQFEAVIRPLVHEGTAILTIQNGLGNEEQLAGLFGAERVLGGMAFVCLNRISPGMIHHIDHGLIRLGEFSRRGVSARARQICEMFNASKVKCQVVEDLKWGRWEKLVWNVPFNGLGAAMDLDTARLLGSEDGIRLVTELMREVVAAAAAVGVRLPKGIEEQKIAQTRTMGAYVSSMQFDRRVGRPLEVEAIFGRPVAVAREHGVATPRLAGLYEMLRVIKDGVRMTDPSVGESRA
jgi:2-dehydropantoate 2-reductase